MGLVDYIMRAIEGTCHDRGFCNVRVNSHEEVSGNTLDHFWINDSIQLQLVVLHAAEAFVSPVLIVAVSGHIHAADIQPLLQQQGFNICAAG